jgi:hypothetical protein
MIKKLPTSIDMGFDNPGLGVKFTLVPETYVRNRAYYIWKEDGMPQGKKLQHWLKAQEYFGNNCIVIPDDAWLCLYTNL